MLDRETVASIDRQAAAENRSRSAQMRHMLQRIAWEPQVTTSPTLKVAPAKPVEECAHVKGAAKSGSGIIGCSKCQASYLNGRWVTP